MKAVKIIKVGNSWAVTIPQELARKHQLEIGMNIVPQSHDEGILYAPVRKKARISKDFQIWLNKTAKQYGPALKALAKK